MDLIAILTPTLPALAWVAERRRGSSEVHLRHGTAVELDPEGAIAGAWTGSFAKRDITNAATSIGTALRRNGDRLLALVGTATASTMQVLWTPDRLVVSNSLALALAAGEDRLEPGYAFYPQDLYTFTLGADRYRRTIPTQRGRLGVYYASVEIDAKGGLRMVPPPSPPRFADYQSYCAMLESEMAAILANAADPARRCRYRPVVSVSAGYDSPAAAVLAKRIGCSEAITFPQPIDRRDQPEDDGTAIARQLGLSVVSRNTFDYQRRTDQPEIEFLAASFGGGQVYLAGTEALLTGRLVVSGGGGDTLWNIALGQRRRPRFPMMLGGYSAIDFFLRLPALEFAVPAIASARWAEIGVLSRSEAMRPWSVGGTYDRPIPRRLLEDAGIARGSFADRKRQVTPVYDSITRRAPSIDSFLSPASREVFADWFSVQAPLCASAARRHKLAVDSYGRIVWSGKLARLVRRLGGSWPPFPAKVWHLRTPMRENAFLFNWAVERQHARYKDALAGKSRDMPMPAREADMNEPPMAPSDADDIAPLPTQFAPADGRAVLRLSPKVTLRRLGEDQGAVVLRLGDGQLYTCNDTTVDFLEAVDGERDLTAIIARLECVYDASPARLRVDLVALAEQLLAEGLIRIEDGAAR